MLGLLQEVLRIDGSNMLKRIGIIQLMIWSKQLSPLTLKRNVSRPRTIFCKLLDPNGSTCVLNMSIRSICHGGKSTKPAIRKKIWTERERERERCKKKFSKSSNKCPHPKNSLYLGGLQRRMGKSFFDQKEGLASLDLSRLRDQENHLFVCPYHKLCRGGLLQ